MSFDNSNEQRLSRLKNRTLHIFHARNPQIREMGRYPLDESTRVMRDLGGMRLTLSTPDGVPYDVPCCGGEPCIPPDDINAGIKIPTQNVVIPPYNGNYNYAFNFEWDGYGDVDTYIPTVTTTDPYLFVFTGATTAIVYVQTDLLAPPASKELTLAITGVNKCGSVTRSYIINYPR
jgi:hypothetical protein